MRICSFDPRHLLNTKARAGRAAWTAAAFLAAAGLAAPLAGQSAPDAAVCDPDSAAISAAATAEINARVRARYLRRDSSSGEPPAAPAAPEIAPAPFVPAGCAVTRTIGPVSPNPNAIYDPNFAAYDSAQAPPITSFNNSAIWGSAFYPDLNAISAMQLTVNLTADTNCQAPSNADISYRSVASGGSGCLALIAPAEFQIGLRGPDGAYYPLLDRESGATAETEAASLCLIFYDNHNPAFCSAPTTYLAFGHPITGVVGKLLTGTWRIVVTRTQSEYIENPVSSGIFHAQGGAFVNNYTLTATTDAPCAADLRLVTLGLTSGPNSDVCKTLGTGNRNGALDPLESADFRPQIFNNGSVNATTTNLQLTGSGSVLTYNPTSGRAIANIAPGATVSPALAINITSADVGCNNLPISVVLTGTAGFSQTISASLQEGKLNDNPTDLASALTDLSTTNLPGSTPWMVSNSTGSFFNSGVSRYNYSDRCGSTATNWPKWTGLPAASPKLFNSEPYLAGPLFTNSSCTARVAPGATLPDPICFYVISPGHNALFGNGVNYIHLDTATLTWGISYNAACTDAGGNKPPRGMDARVTSTAVDLSASSYAKIQLVFNHAFWDYWDMYGNDPPAEPVKRDNIASIEVASSLTDAGASCPLETGSCDATGTPGLMPCRRWCEVYRIQNHSTPFTADTLVDVTAQANNASNVQVRFRYKDDGWRQRSTGDLFWGMRSIKLQGLGAQTLDCNTCAPCQAPVFGPLTGATDASGCGDTGVNISFNNPTDANWGDCPSGLPADCATAQATRRFDLFRSDAPTTAIQSVAWTSAASFTLNDNTGVNGTNYTYRVEAVSGCGAVTTTANSGAIQDHIGVNPVFAGVSSAADNNSCTATGVTLGWATPSDWGDGTGITSTRQYVIQRDIGGGFVTLATLVNPGATISYNDTTVPANTPATYQVIATNRCPLSTGAGITRAATDLAASAPSAFANNSATDNNVCLATGNTVTWAAPAWNDNSIGTRSFTVLRGGVAVGSGPCAGALSSATTTCNDTSAAANTPYTYTVRASNGCVLSTTTTPGTAATDTADVTPPPAVANNLAAKSGSNLSLTWDAASDSCGIANYKVYANAAPTPLTTVFGTPAAATITDPLASGNNYYQITAVDGGGNESPR